MHGINVGPILGADRQHAKASCYVSVQDRAILELCCAAYL